MEKRKIIIHYHIFKNAGTSIDRMLKESFSERWANYDKPEPTSKISPAELEEFILDNPDLMAVSSHHAVPPLPDKHLEVYPILLLRHPIDRAYSAYLFEWKKQRGLEQPIGSFRDYIHEKFRQPRRNAIEDFQVLHLANRGYKQKNPSNSLDNEGLLNNARKLIMEAGVFGLVDRYAESLRLMRRRLQSGFPDLRIAEFHENSLQARSSSLTDRIKAILGDLDECSRDMLVLRNQLDFRLYEYARGRFDGLLQVERP